MTLSDFLRDRIGEDEDFGREVGDFRSPRLLADAAAKRLVVMAADEGNPATEWMSDLTLDWVLRVLALVYSSHEDYNEAWRP